MFAKHMARDPFRWVQTVVCAIVGIFACRLETVVTVPAGALISLVDPPEYWDEPEPP